MKRDQSPEVSNGLSSKERLKKIRLDHDDEADGQDDGDQIWNVNRYKKEALVRQMEELEREKLFLKDKYLKLKKRTKWHDVHLRVVDTWWAQLLDEIRENTTKSTNSESDTPSTLADHFLYLQEIPANEDETDEVFKLSEHLNNNINSKIKGALSNLSPHLSRSSSSLETSSLRKQNSDIILKNKILQDTVSELTEEVDELTSKYQKAQKSNDFQKSKEWSKIFKDSTTPSAAIKTEEETPRNGPKLNDEISHVSNEELDRLNNQLKYHQDDIVSARRNLSVLREEHNKLKTKLHNLSEEDISQTVIFKTLKIKADRLESQHEDDQRNTGVVNKELATLREAQSNFAVECENISSQKVEECSTLAARDSKDLARVRIQRDKLIRDIKSQSEQAGVKDALRIKLQGDIDARDLRIKSLEDRIKAIEQPNVLSSEAGIEKLSQEDLTAYCRKLQRTNAGLIAEMPGFEKAIKKAIETSKLKVDDIMKSEQNIKRALEEKNKLTDKYYAAMMTIDQFNKTIKTEQSHVKSGQSLIENLRSEREQLMRKLTAMDTQVAQFEELKSFDEDRFVNLTESYNALKLEKSKLLDQIAIDSKSSISKEESLDKERASNKSLLEEVKTLKERLGASKKLGSSDKDSEFEYYKKVVMCPVCVVNWKDTMLTTCHHFMCRQCFKDRVALRERRCPTCNRGFNFNDFMEFHL